MLHITGPQNFWAAENRVRGFQDALAADRAQGQIVCGDFSPQSGYDAVMRAVKGRLVFDGVFAANDQMAVGALNALRDAGVRVPDDVRVIGFDDSFVASLVSPALSSIHVPADLIGRYAMELALSRIEDFSQPARLRSVAAELVVGAARIRTPQWSRDCAAGNGNAYCPQDDKESMIMEQFYTLETASLVLKFDRRSGSLCSLYSKASDWEILNRPHLALSLAADAAAGGPRRPRRPRAQEQQRLGTQAAAGAEKRMLRQQSGVHLGPYRIRIRRRA